MALTRVVLALAGVVLALAGCAKQDAAAPLPEDVPPVDILFINVGKADSALISFQDRHYLIDTGTVESLPSLVRALRSQGVKELDGVFLTHTHSDHIGGLEGLLHLFSVKKVYAAEITTNKKNGNNVVDEIAGAAGHRVERLKAGDAIPLDETTRQAVLNVIGPLTFNAEDDNDNSLVIILEAGSASCLFTGDMQFAEERSLLNAKAVKPATLLKVGNHGNPDASSEDFLVQVAPEHAIVSTDTKVDADSNSPRVLAALKELGAKTYTTEGTDLGIAAKMTQTGVTVAEARGERTQPPQGIGIESIDREAELVAIRNESGRPIDLTNWWLFSERGGDLFFFPTGTTLAPNGALTVASGKKPPDADLTWDEKNVWHNSKSDAAILYDSMGNEVARKSLPKI